jgi:hypothetical protein
VEAVADRMETWSRLVFEALAGSPSETVPIIGRPGESSLVLPDPADMLQPAIPLED